MCCTFQFVGNSFRERNDKYVKRLHTENKLKKYLVLLFRKSYKEVILAFEKRKL
jgi:hypothetical protein